MSTTYQPPGDAEARLAALGRRIDSLADNARRLETDARATANRRVDDLRAREARARTGLRKVSNDVAEDRHAGMILLDAELSDMEDELDIAEAELDAEKAADVDAFVRASERAASAWGSYLDRLEARADALDDATAEDLRSSVARAREQRDEAGRRIEQARRSSGQTWASAKKAVRQAMDDLDWTSEQAAADVARYFQ
jgi:hypothetical protein